MKKTKVQTWRAASLTVALITFSLLLTPYHSYSQSFCESGYFFSEGTSGDEHVELSTADSDGNLLVIGYFTGVTKVGDFALTSGGASHGTFLAKYDRKGNVLWAEELNGIEVGGVITDNVGNVIVTGYISSSITLSDGNTYSSNGDNDIIIVKLSSGGVVQWAKALGSTYDDRGRGVGSDDDGNVYVAGVYKGELIFNNDTLLPYADHSKYRMFLFKYDKDGNPLKSTHSTGTGKVYSNMVMLVDGAGNSFVRILKYNSTDIINFGNGIHYLEREFFLVKFDSDLQAVNSFASVRNKVNIPWATALTMDDEGDIYACGYFYQTQSGGYVAFGNDTVFHKYIGPAVTGDRFVVKVDNDCNGVWASKGGDYSTHYKSITVDNKQNVYASGKFSYRSFFGDEEAYLNPYSQGLDNAFFIKFDSIGDFQWVKRLGFPKADGSALSTAISADNYGNIIAYGEMMSKSNVVFEETYELSFGDNTTDDIFVIKMNEVGELILPDFAGADATIDRCDSVGLGDVIYAKYAYSWSPSEFVASPNGYTTDAFPDSTTSFQLEIAGSQCVYKDTVLVTVIQPNFGLDFSASKRVFAISDPAPYMVAFTNLTLSPDDYDFVWYFGDDETSTESNPIHSYQNGGSYNVSLTATDKINACVDSLYKADYIYIPVGIEENNKVQFSMMPNPANDNITIESPISIQNISLYNFTGQVVYYKEIDQKQYTINISKFPPGIYSVQIHSVKGLSSAKLLIY